MIPAYLKLEIEKQQIYKLSPPDRLDWLIEYLSSKKLRFYTMLKILQSCKRKKFIEDIDLRTLKAKSESCSGDGYFDLSFSFVNDILTFILGKFRVDDVDLCILFVSYSNLWFHTVKNISSYNIQQLKNKEKFITIECFDYFVKWQPIYTDNLLHVISLCAPNVDFSININKILTRIKFYYITLYHRHPSRGFGLNSFRMYSLFKLATRNKLHLFEYILQMETIVPKRNDSNCKSYFRQRNGFAAKTKKIIKETKLQFDLCQL